MAFRPLADSVRDYSICLLDHTGVITYWSKGATAIKRWTAQEAEGAHVRFLYPVGGSDDGTAEDHLRIAAEQGCYTGEGRRVRGDGTSFWASVQLTALRDESGALVGFTKVARDLTADRALAEALAVEVDAEGKRRVAAESNRASSRYLAMMGHELRTPITAVLGFVGLLQDEIGGGVLNAKQRHYLERLRIGGERLAEIVDELLDLSRLDAGRVLVERVPVRLGPSINEAIDLVEAQASDRGVLIVNEVSPTVSEVRFFADQHRVQQILATVLANAIRFTESRDGEAGRITVSAGDSTMPAPTRLNPGALWVQIQVSDTGIGITPDRLESIFEPFAMAGASSSGETASSGLALSISRRLARLMGGELTVRSEPGQGSSFILWLPGAPEPSALDAPTPAEGVHAAGAEDTGE